MKSFFFAIACLLFVVSLISASAQVGYSESRQRTITETKLVLARAPAGITNIGTRLVIQTAVSNQTGMPSRPGMFTLLNSLDLGIRRIEVLTVLPSAGLPPASTYTSTNYGSRLIVYDDRVSGIAPTNVFRFYNAIGGTVLLPISIIQRGIEVDQVTLTLPQ